MIVELRSSFRSSPSHAPLVAFGFDRGRWTMWTKHRAESVLRQVVSLAGLQPPEYVLHSLRIGGANHLAAGRASPEEFRREERWAGMTGGRVFVATAEMPSGSLVSWGSACMKRCSSWGKGRSGGGNPDGPGVVYGDQIMFSAMFGLLSLSAKGGVGGLGVLVLCPYRKPAALVVGADRTYLLPVGFYWFYAWAFGWRGSVLFPRFFTLPLCQAKGCKLIKI